VTYQIVVSNAGPSAAVDATVTDALPAGTSFASGSIDGGATCEQTNIDLVLTVSCVAPTIPVGGTVNGTLTLNTTTEIGSTLSNTVVAGAQALDLFDLGNTSLAEALVQAPPDTTTTTTTITTTTTTGPPPTDVPTTTTTSPGTTTSTTTTTTARPATGAGGTGGGGGGRLPATGIAIGAFLVLAGGCVLVGTGLRTSVVDRSRRGRRR